jgi:hypothetical protein
MFGLSKKGPTRPFAHADKCKIVKADPTVEISWLAVEGGHWRRVCQCGPRTSTRRPPTLEFGSTRLTRPPSTMRDSASIGTRPIPFSSGPS